jgi:hypothetical protein
VKQPPLWTSIFGLSCVLIILLSFFTFRSSDISRNRVGVSPPVPTEISSSDITNWQTYSSQNDSFMNFASDNFTFTFPENIYQTYASGVGGSSVTFYSENFDFELDIDEVSLTTTKNYPNLHQETLSNGLVANVASGQSSNKKGYINEYYFLTAKNKSVLKLLFTFKDEPRWQIVKKQILSTFKFVDN